MSVYTVATCGTLVQNSVRCTYPHCSELFATEEEMKSHKRHDPSHHYCRKCDYDAVDWDDLLDHKVKAMAPFIVGEHRHDKVKHMKHLCCEFCGEDFKSMKGRLEHRRQRHQAAQEVKCHGNGLVFDAATNSMVHDSCGQVFMRASDLVEHFEKGKCLFVTPSQFRAERQHRHIIKQILENPEMFCFNMQSSKAFGDGDSASTYASTDISDDLSSVTGGVALLDMDDTSEVSGYRIITPQLGSRNFLDQTIDKRDRPRRQITAASNGPPSWASIVARTPASGPGSVVSDTLSIDSVSSMSSSASSASTIRDTKTAGQPMASTASLASYMATLPDSQEVDWAALSAARLHPSPDMSSNLFATRWYDPHSPTYDPALFYNSLIDGYKCPFAACQATYSEQVDMEVHLRKCHVVAAPRCPICCRDFLNITALVRHFEASVRGSNCRVAESEGFRQLLADVTGGFLEAERHFGREEKLLGVHVDDNGILRIERVGLNVGEGVQTVRFATGTAAWTGGIEDQQRPGLQGQERKLLSDRAGVVW